MSTTRTDSPDTTEPSHLPAAHARRGGAECALWSEWRLAQGRYGALRGVDLEERAGVIHLRGRVPTHYLKQVALAAVCGLAGASPVVNEIEVVNDPRPGPYFHPVRALRRRDVTPPPGASIPADNKDH
jgi:BON domain